MNTSTTFADIDTDTASVTDTEIGDEARIERVSRRADGSVSVRVRYLDSFEGIDVHVSVVGRPERPFMDAVRKAAGA